MFVGCSKMTRYLKPLCKTHGRYSHTQPDKNNFFEAWHFTRMVSASPGWVCLLARTICERRGLKISAFACPTLRSAPRSIVKGKVAANNNAVVSEDDPLVVCLMEMLIDFVPTVNSPGNVTVKIARLGGSSAFVGKVGEDEFRHMPAEILKENNVNNSGMWFDPGARTALAFVKLRSNGERGFMFYRNPSADMLLRKSELDLDLITKAKVFHYSSISLIMDSCESAHLAAGKAAKEAGAVLSCDLILRLPLWPSADSAREGIMNVWEMADVISGQIKGLKVDAVDTTGAGDAFVAGLLSQLASGFLSFQRSWVSRSLGVHRMRPRERANPGPENCVHMLAVIAVSCLSDTSNLCREEENRLRDALVFANSCGAITGTERGAIPALPTKPAAQSPGRVQC